MKQSNNPAGLLLAALLFAAGILASLLWMSIYLTGLTDSSSPYPLPMEVKPVIFALLVIWSLSACVFIGGLWQCLKELVVHVHSPGHGLKALAKILAIMHLIAAGLMAKYFDSLSGVVFLSGIHAIAAFACMLVEIMNRKALVEYQWQFVASKEEV